MTPEEGDIVPDEWAIYERVANAYPAIGPADVEWLAKRAKSVLAEIHRLRAELERLQAENAELDRQLHLATSADVVRDVYRLQAENEQLRKQCAIVFAAGTQYGKGAQCTACGAMPHAS